jgi:hypothetical protein
MSDQTNTKRQKRARVGSRKNVIQSHAGHRAFRDAWLECVLEEVGRACDRFWLATPDRRAIEAARKHTIFFKK